MLASAASPFAASAADFVVGIEDLDLYPIGRVRAGVYEGFARELLDSFARSQGHQFRYQVLPVRRLTSAHLAGDVDLVFPDEPMWQKSLKAEAKADILYSLDMVAFQDAVMVRPPALPRLQTLGVVHGFSPWKFERQIKSGSIQVETAIEPASLLKMVLRGRIDGAYMPLEVARFQLQLMGEPEALVPNLLLLPLKTSHYRASSFRHHGLIRALNQFLTSEAGMVLELRRRYGL